MLHLVPTSRLVSSLRVRLHLDFRRPDEKSRTLAGICIRARTAFETLLGKLSDHIAELIAENFQIDPSKVLRTVSPNCCPATPSPQRMSTLRCSRRQKGRRVSPRGQGCRGFCNRKHITFCDRTRLNKLESERERERVQRCTILIPRSAMSTFTERTFA